MVMAGENEKTVLFSHGRVTLDIKDNAKADYVSTYFIPWTDGTIRGRTGCFGKFDTNDLFVNIYSDQNLYLKDDTSI